MQKLLFAFCFLLASLASVAQAPQAFNYQAIARDEDGKPYLNTQVCLRMSVNGGSGTSPYYQETQQVSTNQFGLFSLQVGRGSVLFGTLGSSPFGNGLPIYLAVEIDINCSGQYRNMGLTELVSVPYALFAQKALNPGPTGPKGSTGATGNTGITGAVGPSGASIDSITFNSTNGTFTTWYTINGVSTPVESDVLFGPTGPKGDTGEIGPIGPLGPTGAGINGISYDTIAGTVTIDYSRLNNTDTSVTSGALFGPIGPVGPVGPIGPLGPTGAGINGISYDTIAGTVTIDYSRLNNTDTSVTSGALFGPQGPKGDIGVTGDIGPTGAQGLVGDTGPVGPSGDTGPQGDPGPTGPQGLVGNTGPVRPSGDTGAQGDPATGPQGLVGNTGPVGPSGDTGAQGDPATGPQGLVGNTGPVGPSGATGPQGDPGPTGAQGLVGNTGPVGPAGPTGIGATGPQGIPGVTGNPGVTGPIGPTGAGATGPPGATGVGVTGPIGPTGAGVTGATGVGTTGPPGPTGVGATGPQGPAGLPGITGATGVGITGPTGTGIFNGTTAGNTTYWDGTKWVFDNNNIYNNGANIGVGTAAPLTKLDLAGDFAYRYCSTNLVLNGTANDNIVTPCNGKFSAFRVTSTNSPYFEIRGISGGVDGKIITFYNASAQIMNVLHQVSSTSVNTINTGGNFLSIFPSGTVTLQYNGTDSKWVILGYSNGNYSGGANWGTLGNGGLTSGNFLGTTDNTPMIIKTSGLERMRVNGNSNTVGINTGAAINPLVQLDVNRVINVGNKFLQGSYCITMTVDQISGIDSFRAVSIATAAPGEQCAWYAAPNANNVIGISLNPAARSNTILVAVAGAAPVKVESQVFFGHFAKVGNNGMSVDDGLAGSKASYGIFLTSASAGGIAYVVFKHCDGN